jgi:hypothetical protein
MKNTLFICALALALIGCQGDKTDAKTETPARDNGTPAVATSTTGATAEAPSETKPVSRDQIPADLKTEAYEYFGLSNDKPVDMEYTATAQPGLHTGSVITTLTEVKDGKPIFTIERTGGLAGLGTQKVSLEKDGIYVIESDPPILDGPQLQMPSDLTPGKSWKNRIRFDQGGTKMDVEMTYTIKGVQKFQTKKGQREGLLVAATGSGTRNGSKLTMESREWHVKGLGPVKAELISKTADGKTEKVLIEESK